MKTLSHFTVSCSFLSFCLSVETLIHHAHTLTDIDINTHTARPSCPQECHSRDSLIHHRCSYTYGHAETKTLTHGAHTKYTCVRTSLPTFMSFQQLYPSLMPLTFRHRNTSRYRGYYQVIGHSVGRGLCFLSDCQVCQRAKRFLCDLTLFTSC